MFSHLILFPVVLYSSTLKGNRMKTLNKLLVTGIAVLGLGAVCHTKALAQPADDNVAYNCPYNDCQTNCYPAPKIHHRLGPNKNWKEFHQQRLTALHDKLKLNAEQEKAWTAYIAATNKNIDLRKPFLSRADFEKMNAVERMESMINRMKTHEQALTEELSALKTFYATLTPEQQKIFDTESLYRPNPHPRRGGRPIR